MAPRHPRGTYNSTRADYIMGRIISNEQWRIGHAIAVLEQARAEGPGLEPSAKAERLEQAIDGALAYLLGKIQRPEPEPEEERGWHAPHAPGEPCPFHDGLIDRSRKAKP